MDPIDVRSINKMAYKRRHNGFCAAERMDEEHLWKSILSIINLVVTMGILAIQQLLPVITNLVMNAVSIRSMAWEPTDPINRNNCDRGVESFTPKECWHLFRFRKEDLPRFVF